MQIYCISCGKQLRSDMRICPHCGKVVPVQPTSAAPVRNRPPQQYPHQQHPQQRQAHSRPQQQRPAAQHPQQQHKQQHQPARERSAPVRQHPEREHYDTPAPAAKKQLLPPKTMRMIYQFLTVAVVVTAIYIAIFIIEVYRIKAATYPFQTRMKLSYSSYGQAFDAYFDEDSWRVNPFTFNCTYNGKSNHGEEYTIVFSAKKRIKVKSITIDEKEIDKSIFEEKLMGMFI